MARSTRYSVRYARTASCKESCSGGGGDRDPPAQLADGRGHRLLVETGRHVDVPLPPHGRVPAAIAAHRVLPEVFRIADVHQAVHPRAGQNGRHRLPQGTRVGAPSLAPAARIEGHHCRLCLGPPGAQPPLPSLGQLERPDDQAPLLPAVQLPGDRCGHGLPPLTALCAQLGGAPGRRAVHHGHGLLPRPHGSHVIGQDCGRQLTFRQRAHGGIAPRLEQGSDLQSGPLTLAHSPAPRAAPGPPGRG
jgi:hypothetical protein